MDNPWEWMWQYANSWRSGPDHSDNWDSTERIIEHNVGLSKYAGNQKNLMLICIIICMITTCHMQDQQEVGMILTF